jgi:pimeloyl-ACP methyl ester carboxylesterase
MAQLSAKPWKLQPELLSRELKSFAATGGFDALVKDLSTGPMQQGKAEGTEPIVIGWGRKDRLCLPRQARRALAAFPGAKLHWFNDSGHFPMWDQPEETARVVLAATG